MFNQILRRLSDALRGQDFSGDDADLKRTSLPNTGVSRKEEVPFPILAEMHVCFENLYRSTNAGESHTLLKMRDSFQDLLTERPEGFSRVRAIAYYESVDSGRVGPYKIDLTSNEGETAERQKSLDNLTATIETLSKIENPHARRVASRLKVLIPELNNMREHFDRTYLLHMRKQRPGS